MNGFTLTNTGTIQSRQQGLVRYVRLPVPVGEFLEQLRSDNVPDELCIVGLEDAFAEDDLIAELALEMDKRANDLEYQSPTIQFAIEGSFHRSGKTYDL